MCHSLAFADPDVCGGGGKGCGAGSPDLPGKSQVLLVYIGKQLLDTPPHTHKVGVGYSDISIHT